MTKQSEPIDYDKKVITDFLKDELQPSVYDLHDLTREAASLNIGLCETVTQRKIRGLESSYIEKVSNFMAAYQKFYKPDTLFADASREFKDNAVVQYMRHQPALEKHIQAGMSSLEYVAGTLNNSKSVVFNRIAMLLSIIAISVSLIGLILGAE